MHKKFLPVAFLCSFFFCVQAEDVHPEPDALLEDEVQQLLEQVDLVLFVLERNVFSMQRYSLKELDSEFNLLTKDISEQHVLFKISMTGPHSTARIMMWDRDDADRVKIIAGMKKKPIWYYFLLDKVLPSFVGENSALVRFDCSVNHTKTLKKGQPKTRANWKTIVDIIVPGVELPTQLVIDGRIDAACGFLVQHDAFVDSLPFSGKIKREEALDIGVLVLDGARRSVAEGDPEGAEAQTEAGSEDEAEPSRLATVFAALKYGVTLPFVAVKNLVCASWNAVAGLFA